MANANPQGKKALIEKANSTVVVVTSLAAFIVVFSLVASKLLVGQLSYQSRVINAKSAALDQLKSDNTNAHDLISAYQGFVGGTTNILGGNPSGVGDQDGNNAKIILDALPDHYDFPALDATLEKILTGQTSQKPPVVVTVNSINGSDNEVTQDVPNVGSAPVAMPFQINVTGDYTNIKNLINVFQHSIRPFQILSLQLSGSQSAMTLDMSAQTYYQPASTFTIKTKVVK
jgi:hypothetical protein